MAYIEYNGKRSDELGLRLTNHREIKTSARDYDLIEIKGVDGAYTQDNDRLKTVEHEFYFSLNKEVVPSVSEISNWINQSVGFKECRLSWDEDFIYYGQSQGSASVTEILKKFGKVRVKFIFHPVKYSKEETHSIGTSLTFNNEGQVKIHPIITLTRASDVTLSINGRKLEFRGIQDNLTIDAKKWMVYRTERQTKVSDWGKMLLTPESERPYLDVGKNVITVSSGNATMTTRMGWRI